MQGSLAWKVELRVTFKPKERGGALTSTTQAPNSSTVTEGAARVLK
jgi:hypothetical protein